MCAGYLAENPESETSWNEANVRKMIGYYWNKIAKQYRILFPEIFNVLSL
jgi:hypothetical protein